MKASERLIAAKNLLATQGWCTNALVNARGQHCAVGGIIEADGVKAKDRNGNLSLQGNPWESPVNKPSIEFLTEAIPESEHGALRQFSSGSKVALYNNAQRDFSVILAWFDRAIELAQAQEMYEELAKAAPVAEPSIAMIREEVTV